MLTAEGVCFRGENLLLCCYYCHYLSSLFLLVDLG